MTAETAPSQALEVAWSRQMHKCSVVDECATEADELMESCHQALARYRQAKASATNAPGEVDFGIIAALMLELEMVVKLD